MDQGQVSLDNGGCGRTAASGCRDGVRGSMVERLCVTGWKLKVPLLLGESPW